MIRKFRGKGINCRYVPLEFSFARRADRWHKIDETRNPSRRQWRSWDGVTPLTNRTCTHAFITFWKLGEASPVAGRVGVRFCRASPRDKSSLCRARKWREQRKKRKGEREREREEMKEGEKCIIFTLDAYPVAHRFLSLYRGSLLREK